VKIDPTLLTALISSGILISIAQLITAIANRISNKRANDVMVGKLDQNTDLTRDIHQVTNGPLTAMEKNVNGLITNVASHAAEARSTAEAAKTQATIDAQASKDKS
jgi:hypothetical protein